MLLSSRYLERDTFREKKDVRRKSDVLICTLLVHGLLELTDRSGGDGIEEKIGASEQKSDHHKNQLHLRPAGLRRLDLIAETPFQKNNDIQNRHHHDKIRDDPLADRYCATVIEIILSHTSSSEIPILKTIINVWGQKARNFDTSDRFRKSRIELAVVKLGVETARGEQLFVTALFDDVAVAHDQD